MIEFIHVNKSCILINLSVNVVLRAGLGVSIGSIALHEYATRNKYIMDFRREYIVLNLTQFSIDLDLSIKLLSQL